MKKVILLFLVCFFSIGSYAQYDRFYYTEMDENGTFKLPDNEKYVTLKFDCSETIFEKKYNEADWALLNGVEEWENAKAEALTRIVEMMNEKMKKTRIILVLENMLSSSNSSVKPNFTMYIKPISLYKNGKNKSVFELKENSTDKVLGKVEIGGSGGRFGSLGNLLGDGYEKSSPQVALLLAKYNKDKKK